MFTDRTYAGAAMFAAVLAAGLLLATLAWHIPFMLWDHLDFAPIYAGWQSGDLAQTGFLKIHGGHLHTAAYALLLGTTWLTHGHPWLDCVVSWTLLVGYATVVFVLCSRTLPLRDGSHWLALLLLTFLALYPGHLANLQWGWQVAVFLCLFGSAVAIASLGAAQLTWRSNAIALAATLIALLSFATALALIPVALLLIALRTELRLKDRILFALPWLLCGPVVAYASRSGVGVLRNFSSASVAHAASRVSLVDVGHYVLNYLGGGIASVAPDLAPWLAVLALASGLIAWSRIRDRTPALPWLGFVLFATIGAVLTGLARVNEGGAQQAFAPRYVSLSTPFWIGWIGLLVLAARASVRQHVSGSVKWLWPVAALALFNALAMTQDAQRTARDTRVLAQTLCASYPQISENVLADMHYGGAQAAWERLQIVHRLGFAPFDACGPNSTESK